VCGVVGRAAGMMQASIDSRESVLSGGTVHNVQKVAARLVVAAPAV
jgi:hypothetical protein